ncbi:MAG: hypothetical protein ABI042_11715 [Verrucomicrobiota bacterium]
MKSIIQFTSISIASLFVITGCQTGQGPTTPQTTMISCQVPTLAAVEGTKEAQEKGGVEISIVPALYKGVQKEKKTVEQVKPPFAALILVPSETQNSQVYVRESTIPYMETEPSRLQFTVRVNNKLSRVFRGQGSVVQFNVGGKLIPFDKVDYKEFLNGIVPPRNETEFTIYGPTLDLVQNKGTVGIFLYDVVTATDVAGNVTEKQNYEWYFSYTTQLAQQQAEPKRKEGFIDSDAYHRAVMRPSLQTTH